MNKVKEKVNNKIDALIKPKQIYNVSSVLQDKEVRQSMKNLQTKLCFVSIDKASKNFSFYVRISMFVNC